MKKLKLSRRHVLRGFGTAMALPLLEGMTDSTGKAFAADGDHRTLLYYMPNGTWQDQRGKLASIFNEKLDPIRDYVSIVEDVSFNGLVRENNHYKLPSTIYREKVGGGGNNIDSASFDNVIADARFADLPYKSVSINLHPSDYVPGGHSKFEASHFSYFDNGTANKAYSNPKELFDLIFSGSNPVDNNQNIGERDAYQKSILDYVVAEANQLNAKLGAEDRARLDGYLTSVRELEGRLGQIGPACDSRAAVPGGHPSYPPTGNGDYRERLGLMQDIIVKAFQCNITGVSTFALGGELCKTQHTWLGLEGIDSWHGNSHYTDSGFDGNLATGTRVQNIKKIISWHYEQFTVFMQKMQAVTDPMGGNLLDNTAVAFTSGMSHGNSHTTSQIPMVIAGKAGGLLKPGVTTNIGNNSGANVWLTLMNLYGLNRGSWGNSSGEVGDIKS